MTEQEAKQMQQVTAGLNKCWVGLNNLADKMEADVSVLKQAINELVHAVNGIQQQVGGLMFSQLQTGLPLPIAPPPPPPPPAREVNLPPRPSAPRRPPMQARAVAPSPVVAGPVEWDEEPSDGV